MRQHAPLKHRSTSMRLRGAISQKAVIFIPTWVSMVALRMRISGVGAKGDHCDHFLIYCAYPSYCSSNTIPVTKYSILCSGISSSCLPKWWNLNLTKGTYSHRMCEAVSVSIWHLPQIGLSVIPSLKRWPFKWQYPVNRHVTCLS
jgi:hypothetical protein